MSTRPRTVPRLPTPVSHVGMGEALGQSEAFLAFQERLSRVARVNRPVLCIGERGTGKELAISKLHYLSPRWQGPLVALNCAALSPALIESELFGHEEGAFTGATRRRQGRFETAHGGTLFLDEIAQIPLEVQEKILRVVEYGMFERVGSSQPIQTDVRIVGATNADLMALAAAGRFKRDLLDRLSFDVLLLPPLRERREDIEMLVEHFVRKYSGRMGKRIHTIPDDAMRVLCNWSWPGNIRELENMVERMVILSKGSELAAPPSELCDVEYAPEDKLSEMERDHIIRVLRETNGILSGIAGAASRLGLKRTTLHSKIKRLGIQSNEYRNGDSTGTFAR